MTQIKGRRRLTANLSKLFTAQAIALAERETNAKGAKLEIERDEGRLEYEIRLRGVDGRHNVTVDGASGRIISNR